MTRLAIIGNSHVGAVKRAWNDLDPRPDAIDVTFFAVPDKQQRFFRLGHDLVYGLKPGMGARTSAVAASAERINGAASLDLSGMDAVVLCGAPVFHRQFSEILAGYDVDGYRAAGASRRMSRAAFEAICDDLGASNLPNPRWLGAAIPRRAVLPRPMPAEGAATSASPDFAFWRVLAARPDGARAMVERLFAGMAGAHARYGIDFLRQPLETIEPSGLTAGVYTRGSTRLRGADEEHPEDDVSHMNARYGALCLRMILDWARQDARATA
jgi:hypothetical protein